MDRFCLDTNIFIEAMEGAYSFDIAPGFWNWLLFKGTRRYKDIQNGVPHDLAYR